VNLATIVTTLIFAPALLAIAYALYAVVCWALSRRGASLKSQMLVGALGPLSILFPGLMSQDSKKYFGRFMISLCVFIAYTAALLFLFGK
jgi:hypothetical protein